jgi:hypothetical protein
MMYSATGFNPTMTANFPQKNLASKTVTIMENVVFYVFRALLSDCK